MIDTIWQDLRHGARMLLKNPGFTVIAVISIAIGVGANAAMFSLADGLVMRPLPVTRPGDVLTIAGIAPGAIFNTPLSYPEYVDVRDQSRSFSGIVAYNLVITSFVNRPDEPAQRRAGMAVSGNYFDAMEVRPALGRWFRPEEDQVPGRDAVVVLDYDEWQQRFAGDPAIVDRHLRVGTVDFTVIGVAPEGFTSIDHDLYPAFYVPLAMTAALQPRLPADARIRRDQRNLIVKGRLKPGVSLAEARQDIHQIAVNLQRSYPDSNRNFDLTAQTQFEAFTSGPGRTDTTFVAMLMTLALAVLIVACANVAGLLTSRAPVRAQEIALRLAVGAGRSRLVRQLVTESLLVAVGGGLLGLAFSEAVIMLFQRIEYPTDLPLKLTFAVDTRVVIVSILAATLAAILSSLIPAWRASKTDLVSTIKNPAALTGKRQRFWGRSVLVSGQIALSLVLLTVSVFLYRSFRTELDKGPGVRTDRLLMVTFEPALARYDDARTRAFYRELTDTTRAMPGVTSVALSSAAPLKAGDLGFTRVAPEGFQFRQGAENALVPTTDVDDHYFETVGIRIVSGRAFNASDTTDAPRVAVVNETFAAHYWPGQNAVGKRIRVDTDTRTMAEVIGVASNAKYFFIIEGPQEFVYFAHMQGTAPRSTLLIATTGPAAALASPMREVVRSIDPNMPVFGVRTMEDFYASRVVYTTNLIVGCVVGMGSMGLVLALVGLYGLVAYSAHRRTREIGIRVAVGASPRSVLRMVLRHGLNLAIGGIVVGLIGSFAANNLLRAAFSRTPVGTIGTVPGSDLVVYAQAVLALIALVLLAAYLPARRASRVDPLVALKTE
jgi:macrolide transport system ATP-binding/permease protein